MLLISRGSHAYKIIMLLLITGEFPFRSLGLLGNERMMKETAVRMTQVHVIHIKDREKTYRCKLINISGKSTLKTIRLNRAAFELIEDEMPELMPAYIADTYGHRFHGESHRIDRNHRIAEAITVCMRSGIECRGHMVPVLQKDRKKYITFDHPAFYSSRSIKRLGVDEMNKSKYIRKVGAIFCQEGLYEVYNSRSSVLEWFGQGEDKIIQTMIDICIYNFPIEERHHAIIFGNDYDVALQTLRRFDSGDKYVRLDYLGYEKVHFLPMDQSGQKILQIMMLKDWNKQVLELIFEEQYLPDTKRFQYDALIEGTYVVSFLDSDILKLSAFIKSVTQEGVAWEVACFDTQVSFLRKYLGENAIIHSLPLDMIHEKLNARREAFI